MKYFLVKNFVRIFFLPFLILIVSCGGGSSSGILDANTTNATSIIISGTAATGAPIVNAKISIECVKNTSSTFTDGKGEFRLLLDSDTTFPCLLELTKSDLLLHGIALQTGTANITPLTELQIAAFAATSPNTRPTANDLLIAWGKAKALLMKLGMDNEARSVLAAINNPSSMPFTAKIGDAHDHVLDQLASRLKLVDITLDDLANQLFSNINNQVPFASFTFVVQGFDVLVDASKSSDSDGKLRIFQWSWGDSSAKQYSNTIYAAHTYKNTGTYIIELEVIDELGAVSDVFSQSIRVPNIAPTANSITAIANGLLVTFDASSSIDVDGVISSYLWNFGDSNNSSANVAIGVTATHAYVSAGSYIAMLTLIDNQSSAVTKTLSITVTPPFAVATGRLNDTGFRSTQCNTAGTGTFSACNSTQALALSTFQDAMVGRDADSVTNSDADGLLGFSFTKIGASGEVLPIVASNWSCIKDNVTGLFWEVKIAGNELRSGSREFTNYDSVSSLQLRPTMNPNTLSFPSASQINALTNSVGYRNAVNAEGLCGAKDWRLPTIDELQSLINYGSQSTDSLDPFSNQGDFSFVGRNFWSSSKSLSSTSAAWGVLFGNNKRLERDTVLLVRLVRTTP